MSALTELLAGAGSWTGTCTLQNPTTSAPDQSASTAEVVSVLGGRFARVDYTWSYRGKPQAGSLLIGCDERTGDVTAAWIDSWHMGNGIMLLRGRDEGRSKLDALGSYPPGDGSPNWGWRIAVSPKQRESIHLVMHNIDPAGREYLAVEARYVPASSTTPRELAVHR
jgi:hypothetical protein